MPAVDQARGRHPARGPPRPLRRRHETPLAAGSQRRLRRSGHARDGFAWGGEPIAFSLVPRRGRKTAGRADAKKAVKRKGGGTVAAGQVVVPPEERTAQEDLDTAMVAGKGPPPWRSQPL